MPQVIRHYGTLKNARNVDGEEVHREDVVWMSSYHQWVKCLNPDNHFVYKSKRVGSSVLCTCGSPAVTVGFAQYKKYSSYIGNEVLMCQSFITSNRHADGSS